MHELRYLKNTPEYRLGQFGVVTCPVCGHPTLDMQWICEHCGWEYDPLDMENEDEYSPSNGMSLREYRELYKVGGVGMANIERPEWIINMHPRFIAVTQKELCQQLGYHHFSCPRALVAALALGKDHPRYEEWATKVCCRLQTISSLVYLSEVSDDEYFEKRANKLTMRQYEERVFDPFCEFPDECRSILENLYGEGVLDKPVTEELVDRTFEKFCAFKRYILPMLANTLEYQYFSFYRYILQYVVEHDEYPEFEVARWYKYPLLPGMTECDIDFDY